MVTRNYPRDQEKIKKLADEGDPGAKWLLEKINNAEIAHGLWMLSHVDQNNRPVIGDIADALLFHITNAGKEAQKDEDDFYSAKVEPVFENLRQVLDSIQTRIYRSMGR